MAGKVVSVFLLSHIIRRFFSQLLPFSSNLCKPASPIPSQNLMPRPKTLLQIPKPFLPIVSVKNSLVLAPRVAHYIPGGVLWGVSVSGVSLVCRKCWEEIEQ